MTMSYKQQLLHPNWQRRRLEILNRDDFRCQMCMDNESTLHVHHKRYVRGRMAWEYEGFELVTLCATCHEEAQAENDAFKEMITRLPVDGPGCAGNAMSLLAGWANGEQGLDFAAQYDEDPHNYMVGEVANLVGWKLRAGELAELIAALTDSPNWVARAGFMELVAYLKEHQNDEAPPRAPGEVDL